MNYFTSEFYCVKCGNKGIPIMRNNRDKRKKGHLKMLYCTHCQEVVNHAEVNNQSGYTYEDFLEDFHNGNFEGIEKKEG